MKRVLRTAMMALLTVSLCLSTMVVVSAAQPAVTTKIEAEVVVTGTPVADAKATFKLTAVDASAPMPANAEVTIPIKEGTNTVSFPIEYSKAGVYEYNLEMTSGTYFLEEYDGKAYHVKVAVTNSADYSKFDVQIGYLKAGDKEKSRPVYPLTLLDLKVVKKWVDQDSSRPGSVEINLLRDKKAVEGRTVVLNSKNNWQATWTGLDSRLAWSVKEAKVPAGYTASYKYSDGIWYVTNTGSLLQTGQLNWPIPVLCAGGFLLLAVGMLLMKRKEEKTDD